MKNYKKGLVGLTIVSAMMVMADTPDTKIYVNTFVDEDGENTNNCSLREAVRAASTHMSYGGCKPTTGVNVIQLEKGEYVLSKELQPTSSMTILGAEPLDYNNVNVITNTYPASIAPQTTITGKGQTRLFNTTINNQPLLTLSNMILSDGYSADRGGALYMGGAVSLSNVTIQNSKAKAGGAVYLSNPSSDLTVSRGNFLSNNAVDGSVVAMSCQDNLDFPLRNVSMDSLSIIGNGDSNSNSTLALCGKPTTAISNATIAQNTVNTANGTILQFSSNSPRGEIALSANATLTLLNNTIVENTAWATLLYDNIGRKALNNNVIAYNKSGKSCRYADTGLKDNKSSQLSLFWNAFVLAEGADQCELSDEDIKNSKDKVVNLSPDSGIVPMSSVLSTLQPASAYTAFMQMYFPVDNKNDTDLVDVGSTQCGTNADQRGISRTITGVAEGATDPNTCDIGSTELIRLTAANIAKTNDDVVALLKGFSEYQTKFTDLINNPATRPDFLPYYKQQAEKYTNWIKYVKSDQKYRTIFADPFAASMPAEKVLSNNGREIKYLSSKNYQVDTWPLGKGRLSDKNVFIPDGTNSDKDKIKCEWDKNLEQILMYRTDDNITATGDSLFCGYSLTLLNDQGTATATKSTGYVIANFSNIAPYAKDATYTIEHGTLQSISVNLLENTNDDGDGNVAFLIDKPNKKPYYTDAQGRDLAINVDSVPDSVAVTAERSGICPGKDNKKTCLGGKIQITVKNTLDPFNYSFKYYVYDADGTPSAAAGTVYLKNTASSASATSGGGSFGIWSLFGLVGLVAYRRYKTKAK
ncbi:CSLREA domain-containing protein [Acinetobacter gerneri]|jgi:CSLREA domain-containing protein|uniref:CSLREA domain-containing protein n=1 Tax=Acinetobacter gerneri TaxID=202952 RepID=UPI0023F38ADB|nr:CSLREA domain-containing protein [Acinetobacter gerneri]MCH4244230.1 CSLREA domain-containing protein [Acinetobacter gerneri]